MNKLETKNSIRWWNISAREAVKLLETSESGLSRHEAEYRLKTLGPNTLPETKTDSLFFIFLKQFKSPLIYILLVTAVAVSILERPTDGITIAIVLLLNAFIGSYQEGKAQKTLDALKSFVKSSTTVLRDTKEITIEDKEIIPGDIIILNEGDKIPADSRIIESNGLTVKEASLTGESIPTEKQTEAISSQKTLILQDQTNVVFKGTLVVSGNGKAVVFSTGINTEIGKIADEIAGITEEMPLKKDFDELSKTIIKVILIFCILLVLAGLWYGKDLTVMISTVVSLAVSLIPEGLPVAITLILATGVWRMSKRNALVKKLAAVEALGQAHIIAVDKTGTLTKNELCVEKIFTGTKLMEVSGSGLEPNGVITYEGKEVTPALHPELSPIGLIAALCNKCRVSLDQQTNTWEVFGDPTEGALIVLADKMGMNKDSLLESFTLEAEIPFDYKRRYRAVLYKNTEEHILLVLGAPEAVLKNCELSPAELEYVKSTEETFAKQGFRVLAGAYKEGVKEINSERIPTLKFGALFAMSDSLHENTQTVVRQIKQAGIEVVMITGDNKLTAQSIAAQAGILDAHHMIITGDELMQMTDHELLKILPRVKVFARITPEHKLKLVEGYKKLGKIIAMTGDGVNDVPALTRADLGIAMGKTGTEVTKEAASIVLLDDNLGSIAAAIEEGRSIFRTIQKVIIYLFSTGVGETLTITAALFINIPLPLLPTQIIWLNFVTDGFLTVALAMEPKEEDLLKRVFHKPSKYILTKTKLIQIVLMASTMAAGTLILFYLFLPQGMIKALTISMTTLAVFQWMNAFNCRDFNKSIFKQNPFSNPWLLLAIICVAALQIASLNVPIMQKFLHTEPLSYSEWALVIGVSTLVIWVEEARKLLTRR